VLQQAFAVAQPHPVNAESAQKAPVFYGFGSAALQLIQQVLRSFVAKTHVLQLRHIQLINGIDRVDAASMEFFYRFPPKAVDIRQGSEKMLDGVFNLRGAFRGVQAIKIIAVPNQFAAATGAMFREFAALLE